MKKDMKRLCVALGVLTILGGMVSVFAISTTKFAPKKPVKLYTNSTYIAQDVAQDPTQEEVIIDDETLPIEEECTDCTTEDIQMESDTETDEPAVEEPTVDTPATDTTAQDDAAKKAAEEEAAAKLKAEQATAAKLKLYEQDAAARLKLNQETAARLKLDEENAAAKLKSEQEAAAKLKLNVQDAQIKTEEDKKTAEDAALKGQFPSLIPAADNKPTPTTAQLENQLRNDVNAGILPVDKETVRQVTVELVTQARERVNGATQEYASLRQTVNSASSSAPIFTSTQIKNQLTQISRDIPNTGELIPKQLSNSTTKQTLTNQLAKVETIAKELKKSGKTENEINAFKVTENKKVKAAVTNDNIVQFINKSGIETPKITPIQKAVVYLSAVNGDLDQTKLKDPVAALDNILNGEIKKKLPTTSVKKKGRTSVLTINEEENDYIKPTTGLRPGTKFSEQGGTVHARCNADTRCDLVAYATNDEKILLDTKIGSSNNKVVFTFDQGKIKPGTYVMQVEATPTITSFEDLSFASVVSTESSADEKSDPILVTVVSDPGVPVPVIESIDGVNVKDLIRDLSINASTDGKVSAIGTSDITTTVIGSFKSAIFTSAILADAENGKFEIASTDALEAGEHEVVIYATRPEEKVQSTPVKVKFQITNAAQTEKMKQAAASEASTTTTTESKFPLIAMVIGGLVILLIGLGIYFKRRK